MFEGIKSFIREAWIKFDYPRYEKERMAAHRVESERRYDVCQLQIEISAIKHQAGLAGDQRFDSEIISLRRLITEHEKEIHRIREQLAILERNYKSEIDELYTRKKQLLETKEELFAELRGLRAERSRAHDDLNEAYADLESAKNDVDRWYKRSERTPWLWGSGGRKLPKHSIFVQSFGDLEDHKSRRGYAVHAIGKCKDRIANIKERQAESKRKLDKNHAEIGQVLDKVLAVKADRQRMFELKKEGFRQGPLRQKLREYLSTQAELGNRSLVLEGQRCALVEETEFRLGLKEREAAVADLLARKSRFMDEFHSDESKAARLDQHRRQWLARRGHKEFDGS